MSSSLFMALPQHRSDIFLRNPIPFVDLSAQQTRLRTQLDAAIARVLDHSQYIMGPEIERFEKELASFTGAQYVVTCSSGTDALFLALLALGVREGDAVFVPSFTFCATAEAVVLTGATPVFVDVRPDTFNLDASALVRSLENLHGLRPCGVIPVDLFGQPADYQAIQSVADSYGLWILSDAAQSLGATDHGKKVGTLACLTATSFFPSKPLGGYGDGGALFTDDAALVDVLKSLRVHGQGAHKYDAERIGLNARMDTLQAAILLEKLTIFPEEIIRRQQIAETYAQVLPSSVRLPYVRENVSSVWAQYTILLPEHVDRDEIRQFLASQGVPSVIYYEKPLHHQKAYQSWGGDLPVSDNLSKRVLSLPFHAYLQLEDLEWIGDCFHRALDSCITRSYA